MPLVKVTGSVEWFDNLKFEEMVINTDHISMILREKTDVGNDYHTDGYKVYLRDWPVYLDCKESKKLFEKMDLPETAELAGLGVFLS